MGNIIAGLIAIALGVLAAITWPWRMLELLQGIAPIALIGIGIVAIFAGIEMSKENASNVEDEEDEEEDDSLNSEDKAKAKKMVKG